MHKSKSVMQPAKGLEENWPRRVKRGGSEVAIYRTANRGRVMYQVAYWLAGKRLRKSFARYADAHTHADQQATLLNSGRLAVAQMPDSDREAVTAAKRELAPLGVPLLDAVKSYVAATKLLAGRGSLLDAAKDFAERHADKLATLTVAECVEKLLASRRKLGVSDIYLNNLGLELRKFAKAFSVKIDAVTAATIEAWLDGQTFGAIRRNKLRGSLIMVGVYARDVLRALPSGLTEFHRVPKANEAEAEIAVVKPEGMAAMLTTAERADATETVLWLALGGFAGLRPWECMRLKWEDVEMARGVIRVKAAGAKMKAKRVIPILPNLGQWLALHHKDRGAIFTKNADERAQYFAREMGEPIPRDGLRHSYGTYRLAVVADMARTAYEMGNSAAIIRKHYDAAASADEGAQWFAIVPATPANVIAMKGAA